MIIVFAFVVLLVPVFVAMILAAVFGVLMIFGRWCYGWKGEVIAVAILLAGSFLTNSWIQAWFDLMWAGVDAGAPGMVMYFLQQMYWGTVALAALFVIGGRVSGFK
ncbi:hypothetical protein [Martelella sp. FOR1707]